MSQIDIYNLHVNVYCDGTKALPKCQIIVNRVYRANGKRTETASLAVWKQTWERVRHKKKKKQCENWPYSDCRWKCGWLASKHKKEIHKQIVLLLLLFLFYMEYKHVILHIHIYRTPYAVLLYIQYFSLVCASFHILYTYTYTYYFCRFLFVFPLMFVMRSKVIGVLQTLCYNHRITRCDTYFMARSIHHFWSVSSADDKQIERTAAVWYTWTNTTHGQHTHTHEKCDVNQHVCKRVLTLMCVATLTKNAQ